MGMTRLYNRVVLLLLLQMAIYSSLLGKLQLLLSIGPASNL